MRYKFEFVNNNLKKHKNVSKIFFKIVIFCYTVLCHFVTSYTFFIVQFHYSSESGQLKWMDLNPRGFIATGV